MKIIFLALCLFLFACSSTKESQKELSLQETIIKQIEEETGRKVIVSEGNGIYFPLNDLPKIKHKKNKDIHIYCNVYQYYNNDSIRRYISKITYHNSKGQICKIDHNNHAIENYYIAENTCYERIFNDSLRVGERQIEKNGDKEKWIVYYYSNNKLQSQITYNKVKIIKRKTKNGGKDDSDYKRKPTWSRSDSISYTYDSLGRKKESYFDKSGYTFKYLYNNEGKLAKINTYYEDSLACTKYYLYNQTGYKQVDSCYSKHGRNSLIMLSTTYEFDANNREVCRSRHNNKGALRELKTTEYYSDGRIKKVILHNSDSRIKYTQLYSYPPRTKNNSR